MAPRIAMVGAGAVGGYAGAGLAAAGHDVTLIDPWPAHVEAIRAHGMELYGMTEAERRTVPVRAIHLTEVQRLARERPIDIAFIAVKSYDTEWAASLILPYLAANGVCVSMQNCINEERLAGVVGWGRTLGCIVTGGIGVDLFEPGHISRNYAKNPDITNFYIGEPHGRITARAKAIAALLNDVDTAHATDDLWGERWTKLCVNGMRNGVSAATGMSGNERDADPEVRRFCIRLGAESVRIGQRLGFRLGPIGRLDPERLARAGEGEADALAEIEALMVAGTNSSARAATQRPSMAQDMAKGRRTEIEFMNGFIAEKGREAGIPAPAHAKLTRLVQAVERGEKPAARETLLAD
ncbi:MAG: ketopantoate reductase family protein [Rhodospirillales bacterium]|nr:ketopantoate reductase family protein [Rhodospirillales bacterium]